MKIYQKLIIILLVGNSLNAQNHLPDIELRNLNNSKIAIVDANNTGIAVYSFWATWCVPCINELDAIHEEFMDWQDEIDFKFFAVSIDDSRTISKVKPMVNAKLWDFEVLYDSDQDFKRFLNIEAVPYLIIVKNNKIVYRHTGYSKGSEFEIFEKIKQFSN